MHNRVQMWIRDPLSKIFLTIIEDRREKTYKQLLGAPKEEIEALRERLKIYHSILDLDRLFEGELEEIDE